MDSQLPEYKEEQEIQVEESLIDPSLNLSIDDKDLISLINRRTQSDEQYYKNELKLDKRRKTNENFWIGNHFDESELDPSYQIPYKDNLIWQDTETRIGIAAARLPDILIIPPSEDPEAKERAKMVEDGLDIRINNDSIRRLIKDGIRDNHIYLTGAIKPRWDPTLGESGEFIFEKVDPKKISFDHTATIPHDGYTSDNMELIYEWIEEPVGLIMAKFPKKKEELLKELGIVQQNNNRMASKLKYLEVWFTWFDKSGERQEGVCWKYKNIILDKSKNPYYDWEGIEKPYQDENGQYQVKTIYQNFFDRPRKPYVFFSHMNLGHSPIDDTSPIEQAIPIQRNINKRGRQITEIADNAVPKKVFNGNFITKEEARRVTNDPNESIWLDGADLQDVNKAFTTIRSDSPSPILYNDLIGNRGQVDSKFATHSVTRGELTPQESGISKQITREGDLTVSDDLVETMVVRVVSELAGWALQMMKTMYNKEHFVNKLGKDGEMVALSISQDKIDPGIALQVKASTIDKTKRRAEAMTLAAAQRIDPLTQFEDMDVPNPKERAKRLIAYMRGQLDGYASYEQVAGLIDEEENAPQGQPGGDTGQVTPEDQQKAYQDIQTLFSGQPIEPQEVPTAGYIQTLMEYANSGELEQLSPEIQQNFLTYIQKLKSLVGGQGGQPVGNPAQESGGVLPADLAGSIA